MPAQFHTGVRSDSSLCPEKRLMLAVLEEAVGDYQRHLVAAGRLADRQFRNAESWFLSEDTRWPYSFVNVCHALGLDVGWLRAGLARWREGACTCRARRGRRPHPAPPGRWHPQQGDRTRRRRTRPLALVAWRRAAKPG